MHHRLRFRMGQVSHPCEALSMTYDININELVQYVDILH